MADEYPDPARRIKPGASGTPITLADGRTWLLADGGIGNDLDEIRDRIFDDTVRRGDVSLADVCGVAAVLLATNYHDLSEDEFLALVRGVDGQSLTEAVRDALFGPPKVDRGYSLWAESQLIANGIDPASVPSRARHAVLETLVATGRAIPQDVFVTSVSRAGAFAELRSVATAGKAKA